MWLEEEPFLDLCVSSWNDVISSSSSCNYPCEEEEEEEITSFQPHQAVTKFPETKSYDSPHLLRRNVLLPFLPPEIKQCPIPLLNSSHTSSCVYLPIGFQLAK